MSVPLTLLIGLGVSGRYLIRESAADLENLVFTSRDDRFRMLVPRGWRASDQRSYPGLVLWMARSQPQGQMDLTAERFTRELYCSWPVACRASNEAPAAKYACALRAKLETKRMRVGPTQAGPKDNEVAGLPSVWFDYDDGKRFLRHAIALSSDRAFSLVLSTTSIDARTVHARAFDQALRTFELVSAEETARAAGGIDAAVSPPPSDGGAALPDGAVLDAGVTFESAPAPTISPIGPCSG